MGRHVIVAGTGFEGRESIIRRYCRDGVAAELRREPLNTHDPNAIAVLIRVPGLFGLLGSSLRQIGYIKADAARGLAKRLDAGEKITARVTSFYAPRGRDFPRVSLELVEEEVLHSI